MPAHLQPCDPSIWTGRSTTEAAAYWYQQVQCLSVEDSLLPPLPAQRGLAIIGYAVDAGVARNLGRVGAAAGAQAIRERLAREPWHAGAGWRIVDCGDVICEGDDVEAAQRRLAQAVAEVRAQGYFSVVLGGGHDQAFGHFAGLRFSLDSAGRQRDRLGVVNFDAHLDLRPLDGQGATSGTPFTQVAQLCADLNLPFDYACLGAQLQANTATLWASAKTLGVQVISLAELANTGAQQLEAFCAPLDQVHVTVDLDGFPNYISPGVSAPGVEGFSVELVRSLLAQLMATGKVVGLDFAECNPSHDIDGRTARLAARLIAGLL